MSRFIKRFLFLTIVFSVLFQCLPAYSVYGVSDQVESFEQGWVSVSFSGAEQKRDILISENKVYAPISWISYYGPNIIKSTLGKYQVYYRQDQKTEKNFAKKTFIDPETNHFSVGVYFDDKTIYSFIYEQDIKTLLSSKGIKKYYGKNANRTSALFAHIMLAEHQLAEVLDEYYKCKNAKVKLVHDQYVTLFDGYFTNSIKYDNEYWVPAEELLPLIEAEVFISDSIYMSPVVMTTLQALYLYSDSLEDLLFDADEDIINGGKEFMTINGYVVSSAMDLRIDRMDIVFNSGRINDYENIFTGYLTNNEAYLKSFSCDNDPVYSFLEDLGNGAENLDNVFGFWSDLYDLGKDLLGLKAKNPKLFDAYIGNVQNFTGAMQGAMKMINYVSVFSSQVEDHRNMLSAVYDYAPEKCLMSGNSEKWMEYKEQPSYIAAKNIEGIYNTDCVDIERLFGESVRDLTNDIIVGKIQEVTFSSLGPWYIAIEASKFLAADSYEYIAQSAVIGLVDNTVSKAFSTFESRIEDGDFNIKKMNDLRLCAIMSLIASRHAYCTYWDNLDISKIDAALKDFYLSGVWGDYDNKNTYDKLHKKYSASIDSLASTKEVLFDISEILTLDQSEIESAFGSSVTFSENSTVAHLTKNGENIEITYDTIDGTTMIRSLRIAHNGNALPLYNNATTASSIEDVKKSFDGAESWMGPYTVYLNDGSYFFESTHSWTNPLNKEVYFISIDSNSDNNQDGFYAIEWVCERFFTTPEPTTICTKYFNLSLPSYWEKEYYNYSAEYISENEWSLSLFYVADANSTLPFFEIILSPDNSMYESSDTYLLLGSLTDPNGMNFDFGAYFPGDFSYDDPSGLYEYMCYDVSDIIYSLTAATGCEITWLYMD